MTGNGVFSDDDWVESKDQNESGKVRLIQLADIGAGTFKDKSNKHLTSETAKELNCTFLQEGDVLIARMPDPLGRATIFPGKEYPCVTVVDVCIARPGPKVKKKWLMYVINSPSVRRVINSLQSGTTRKRISRKNLAKIEIPVPPIGEQKRIVAKIEELFSKLDSGVKDIQTANKRVGQYNRTVLQNAVEGKLTKSWRLNQEDIVPTVQLLQCTEELREDECGGKYGKLIEPTDIPDAIELPENWAWSSLSQIGEVSRGKSTHRPRDDASLFGGEYPFIQTGEVRAANTVLNSFEQTYNKKGLEQSRLWPEGTLCITIAANIGETAILGIEACFPDSVVGFLTNPEYCNVHYIELYFRTIQRDLERYAPATAQKNINLGTLSDLPIPLPPIKEQDQIVQQVHSDLSVLTNNMETISNELVRSERLRQSILKQAFRGELVPQNQYDESEEIRPERASSEPKPESQKQATLSEVTSDVE